MRAAACDCLLKSTTIDGDYAYMRRMRIRLPRATRAAELGETRECPESCPCPQHGRLAA